MCFRRKELSEKERISNFNGIVKSTIVTLLYLSVRTPIKLSDFYRKGVIRVSFNYVTFSRTFNGNVLV